MGSPEFPYNLEPTEYPSKSADPAQSAPSAESTCWLKLKALLQKWNPNTPLCTKDDCPSCQSLRAEIFAELEAYAALRTAQLERELADALKPHTDLWTKYEAEVDKWSRRAETAESALRQQRELIVNEAVEYLKEMAKLYHRDNEHTAGTTLSKCAIGIRHALTVAAQTPQVSDKKEK